MDLGKMFGAEDVETFLGLPKGSPEDLNPGDIAILGAASATPYVSVGPYCANGPKALRAASKSDAACLKNWHFDLAGPVLAEGVQAFDFGDCPFEANNFAKNRQEITDRVGCILSQGGVPVVLGGDDSVPIPVMTAFRDYGPVTILQIDAHIDWRDEVNGERLGLSSTMRRASEMNWVGRIIQVGQRGLGSAGETEVSAAQAYGARFVPMTEVRRTGVASALEQIEQDARVVISFDVDALDPSIMPGIIARTGGGLSYDHIIQMIDGVAERAKIVGFNVVEFMPERDIDAMGAMTASQLILHAIGRISRQS